MQRVAFKMKLFRGFEKEYQSRHASIWPELKSLLHSKGIHDYSIFLDESSVDLFAVFKIPDTLKLADLSQEPVMKKWWKYMKGIMETNDDDSPVTMPLKEVFYLE
jgi:L-rhamnose mutarotase